MLRTVLKKKVLFRGSGPHGTRYANFTSLPAAMELLFIVMTGDGWTDSMQV